MNQSTEPSPPDEPPKVGRWPGILAALGVATTVASILALAGLQYGMPDSFQSGWVVFPRGVRHFEQNLLGRELPQLDAETFRFWFQVLLGTAWAGYALAVVAGLQGGVLPAKPLLITIVALPLVLAIGCPPSLSSDSYTYVGDARLWVVHGRNPYRDPSSIMKELGDPWADYMPRPVPTVYGPVWLVMGFALTAALSWANLWANVVALKLLAGAGLIVCVSAGRALADHFAPGRGTLTLLAIGLNPLFLLEGPANGHNDLLMMALLLCGLLWNFRGRHALGTLLIGLAVGIKYAPAALLPWLIWEQCRGLKPALWWRPALCTTLLLFLPTALCYIPLAGDSNLQQQLQRHFDRGLDDAARVEHAARHDWLQDLGLPGPLIAAALVLFRQWPILLLYVGLSIWIVRSQAPDSLLNAWSTLSLGLIMFTLGVWFPWYMVWPWSVSLTRWDRWPLYTSMICFVLAIPLTLRYSYVW
jgi:hypothetical protein